MGSPPHQQLLVSPLNFRHLKVFGCVSFVHINIHRDKWSHKFVGYDLSFKKYQCFCVKKNKIIISEDVIFDEDHLGFSPTIVVKVILATIEPCMNFPMDLPILEDLTLIKSDVPNGLLPPPIEIEVL